MVPRWASALGVVVWLAAIATGARLVYAFETTPGSPGTVPATWPTETTIPHTPGRPIAVLFVHPACPCTRATLTELAAIVHAVPATVEIAVVSETEVGEPVLDRMPPGATLVVGRGEHARFDAKTSGHLVVYDATGHLRFSGGITGSRGHIGANVGRASVIAILTQRTPITTSNAVFGCSL